MMYHRMYLRRSSMSSISEESETGEELNINETIHRNVCNSSKSHPTLSLAHTEVEHCLGDLKNFKRDIRDAYHDLSTLERQARSKSTSSIRCELSRQDEDLDYLLEQLRSLEKRFDQEKDHSKGKSTTSSDILAQFDELDQALATLTKTINNVEIEFVDSGNSSSSSGISDSTRIVHQGEGDEQLSDSGLSQSTDSISSPLAQKTFSNSSSNFSTETNRSISSEKTIRLALEKLEQANIKKLFVKIYTNDNSMKNVLIDETMSIHQIVVLLLQKFRIQPTIQHVLVEDLTDLHLYRILEDHQNLINDVLIYWPRESNNRIVFREEKHRYSMFQQAKDLLEIQNDTNDRFVDEILDDCVRTKKNLFFDDVSTVIYIKDKKNKSWKKIQCVLRQSGIYQIPKSSSILSAKRELVCLMKFDQNSQVYYANNWVDVLRSPTPFGFALKYVHIQKKSTKYIHYLCTNTQAECQRWINGIRMILYGEQLLDNYRQVKSTVNNGIEHFLRQLPEKRLMNFIPSARNLYKQPTTSTISLPINQIVFQSREKSKDLLDLEIPTNRENFRSLERPKKKKSNFRRSSSVHSNLHQPKNVQSQDEQIDLKRSKSSKEIFSNPKKKENSQSENHSSSIIPLIQQCIHHGKHKKRSLPNEINNNNNNFNHIYDSLEDLPVYNREIQPRVSLPTRVTEL